MKKVISILVCSTLLPSGAIAAPKSAAPAAKRAAPAPALSPAQFNDLKCYATLAYMVDQAEEPKKKDVSMIMMIFLGKMVGRVPGTNVGKLVAANEKALNSMNIEAEQARCSSETDAIMNTL